MPFNLIKEYPDLLDIMFLPEFNRKQSLRKIFDRDITFNKSFSFNAKQIRPTKKDGEVSLSTVFNHLITEDEEIINEDGSKYKKRSYEKDRAERLHWLKPHVENEIKETVHIFSVSERNRSKRKDVVRTYIYNEDMKYVVVLEPQNSNTDYYLLTAYYLNKSYAVKQMKKKMKKKLQEVY